MEPRSAPPRLPDTVVRAKTAIPYPGLSLALDELVFQLADPVLDVLGPVRILPVAALLTVSDGIGEVPLVQQGAHATPCSHFRGGYGHPVEDSVADMVADAAAQVGGGHLKRRATPRIP